MIVPPDLPQIKKAVKHFYGYRATNVSQTYRYRELNNYPLQELSPVGSGRLCSIRQKFQTLFGDVIINNEKGEIIHPLFIFLLQRLVYYQSFNPQQISQLQFKLCTELVYQMQKQKILQKLIEQTIINCLVKEKIQIGHQHQLTRFQKIKLYNEKIQKLQAQMLPELKIFLQKTIKNDNSQLQTLLISNQYIRYMVNNTKNIEPLRIDQQWQKIRLFAERNKNYFNTLTVPEKEEKITQPYPIYIIANKTSKEQVPVLQKISEFIRLLPPQINYQHQSCQIIKDLFLQITKYNRLGKSQKTLAFYQFLSPDTIVFDHLALAPKLLLEPLLLDALGLRHKPCSVQNFLTFTPCPKQFNFFQSPQQLESDIQLMLNDPFWSSGSFFKKIFNSKQKKQPVFEEEKKHLYNIKERICVWRFLLTSYYIKNRKQFGKPLKIVGDEHSKKHFTSECKRIQKQLKENMSKLSEFIGIQNQCLHNKSFKFLISQISNYYKTQNDDSLVDIGKYFKINKCLTLKRHLVECIINLFKNQHYWSKVYNVKKIALIFLLVVNQILQISNNIIKMQKRRSHDRKQFNRQLQKNRSWRILQNPLYSYMQDFLNKIKEYKNRNQKDVQSRYLNKDDVGVILFKNITTLFEQISKLKKLDETLNMLDESHEMTQQQKTVYANYVEKNSEEIRINLVKTQCLIRQLLFVQSKNKPKESKQNKLLNQVVEKRTELIFYTYLTLSEENLIEYQSLVIPLLKLTSSKMEDLFKAKSNRQQLTTERQWLKIAQQIIRLQRLIPNANQLHYLVKSQQSS